ncbi:stage II sporulation protein E, partial [Clostridium saudiense]|nr:stage II sporulation protein E [Clostridium saudiense]
LISIAIILCLIVAGIGGVEVFGVNIRNLLGIMVVTTIAYSGGISAGTIIGVTMGIIIGITTGDLLWPIGIYSICGLTVGIFKDTGKVFSVLAYVISYFLVVMYSDIIGLTNILEVSISAIWVFLIPNNFIKNILAEIN